MPSALDSKYENSSPDHATIPQGQAFYLQITNSKHMARKKKQLEILRNDPWLEPFEAAITVRH
ncbi:MAG: hypothetical protein K2I92_02940, partial [Muribaculaceae bacterium]|nr:hypothetical protein [Muribaculaceae bacterium]